MIDLGKPAMKYIETIANLPLPTQPQIERFTTHVLTVHSWYKQIPLIAGSVFTVYLEPDLDREYPTQHPKLPYGNTKEGYQKAFGHLSYQYCMNQYCYQDFCDKIVKGKRIECEITEIPKAHKAKWSFNLYPYCHEEFEEGISLFEADIQLLENGGMHPQRELLLHWHKFLSQRNTYWENNLNDEDRDFLASMDGQEEAKAGEKFPQPIFDYIQLESAVWEIEEKLRLIEKEKLSHILEKLMTDVKQIKKELAT